MRPVILLMLRAQAVNLPPWKIVTWFYRVMDMLKNIEGKLKDVAAGSLPCKDLLPKLSEHWEELTANDYEEDDDDVDVNAPVGTFQVTFQITFRQRVCFLQFALCRAVFPVPFTALNLKQFVVFYLSGCTCFTWLVGGRRNHRGGKWEEEDNVYLECSKGK